MQSSSCSPKKKLIRKNSKISPTKPRISKTKSLIINKNCISLFSQNKSEEAKSIENIQNQLQKLSQSDKLYELQSITIGQIKKICNFVCDKKFISKLQALIQEDKVEEMQTEEVQNGENCLQNLSEMFDQKVCFGIDINENMWGSQEFIKQVQYPVCQNWWLRDQDYGSRLDLF